MSDEITRRDVLIGAAASAAALTVLGAPGEAKGASKTPSTKGLEADYVIVGAGAAGAVIAARLAESGKHSVIVVEAGPDNAADPTIQSAAKYVFLYDLPGVGPTPSPSHWGFQTDQNGKKYCYPRGTGMGGSVNHHAMVDGRGSPHIYDRWAKATGDERWSYQRLLPFFMKLENFDVPYVDERVHGKKGWLHIKRPKWEKGFHPDLVNVAMHEFGIPFRHDFYDNPLSTSGIGAADIQVQPDGRRSNAIYDLLLPTLEKTKKNGWNNLQILTDKLVTRIVFEKNHAVAIEALDSPRAYKVDAAHQDPAADAKTITVKAKKEIILCGGAINTPQILMLSGVGPAAHLKQLGIPVVKDLAGVGSHLQDHMEVGHVFEMKKLPNKVFRWQATVMAQGAPKYAPIADPSVFTENGIPIIIDWFSGVDTPDPLHPDLHIHVCNFFFRDFNYNPKIYKDADPLKSSDLATFVEQLNPEKPRSFATFLIETVKNSPTQGAIRLQSKDPTVQPILDERLFEEEGAAARLAKGIELIRKMMGHPDIMQYGPDEVFPGPTAKSTADLETYLKKYSSFGHHISGTAKMGKASDSKTVVDASLKVHGLKGLRVCDASIFPDSPSYNPSRACYMVAEVLSDMIVKGG